MNGTSLREQGYGDITKTPMTDRRLSPTAKAIYSYLCSFAGNGNTAFPRQSKIIRDMGISKGTYYTHFNQLKELGYVKVEQAKDKSGRFKHNIYTIADTVPLRPNIEPFPSLPHTAQPYTENLTPKINNNKYISNNIQSSPVLSDGRDGRNSIDEYTVQLYTEYIKSSIGYDGLAVAYPNDIELIDEMILILLDVLLNTSQTVRIDGENKPVALAKGILMKVTCEDIEHVIRQFKAYTRPVKRKRQFILTMLYNSKAELNTHYTNLYESRGRRHV